MRKQRNKRFTLKYKGNARRKERRENGNKQITMKKGKIKRINIRETRILKSTRANWLVGKKEGQGLLVYVKLYVQRACRSILGAVE